jgi:3-oxoacyl-[acyl-carrier protein] reductase
MDLGLKGKVALVAAGSQGMGRATVLRFAAEGATVAFCARGNEALSRTAEEARAKGLEVLAVQADVSTAEGVKRFVGEASGRFGRIDILVVNAGGPPPGTFEALGEGEWQRGFDLTLMSAVRLIREALPHIPSGGRIIAISSTSVKEPIANLLLSNSFRLAVAGALKTLAAEVGPRGITVNAVLPGYINTSRLNELFEKRSKATGEPVDGIRSSVLGEVPLGRFGQPEEVADLIAYLASDRAAYITGTFIPIDGGRVQGY